MRTPGLCAAAGVLEGSRATTKRYRDLGRHPLIKRRVYKHTRIGSERMATHQTIQMG